MQLVNVRYQASEAPALAVQGQQLVMFDWAWVAFICRSTNINSQQLSHESAGSPDALHLTASCS
jgi:hypothetical protein